MHRPGPELRRLTPRNNDDLLFDGVPWLDRAQEEHDQFAETLRAHDVEVLYLHELLTEVLDVPEARGQLLDSALRPDLIGPSLVPALREHLGPLPSADLARVLMAGMAREELPVHPGGLVEHMVEPQSFVIRPLPNLLFTRDSAVWLDHGVAVTQLAMPARRRESAITGAIYRHHPRFAGTELLYGGSPEDQAWLEGGDVLVLGARRARHRRRSAHEPGRRRGVRPAAVRGRRGARRCWPCRSPRTARRCTSTPSARWSTATRWSCTRRWPTRSTPSSSRRAASATASRSWPPPRGRWASASCA